MKNFIVVTLDDLILSQRIYRWTILLSGLIRGFILRDFGLAYRVCILRSNFLLAGQELAFMNA